MEQSKKNVVGYLPDETPPPAKLIVFALQQILVMFPATVLVAILTRFDIATTIFASGFATICFLLITKRQIPLYYGSSFAYIAAITGLMASQQALGVSEVDSIRMAQFGIMMSGLVSIGIGLIIKRSGQRFIERVLPPTITGPIALVIAMSLAKNALDNAAGGGQLLAALGARDMTGIEGFADLGALSNYVSANWAVALITLVVTILFSVYLKGTLSQLPILFGILVGYAVATVVTLATPWKLIDFAAIANANFIAVPRFTLPSPNMAAVAAIMPIALATVPESTAHLFQLDIYVNELARRKGSKKTYSIGDKLGLNLIGDGVGDIVSAAIGGPAGTNYGENISTMAITRNFSTSVLIAASIITMLLSFSGTLSTLINSIPQAVIGGISIYLFGVIGAQGIAIMISQKVDMFDSRNLAVISTILIIGIGGSYINNGMIPMFGIEMPAIATASVFGIILNLVLSFGHAKQAGHNTAE
ncbi:MAG: solute carrier family 23 protein [Bacillota bacterium]|nr:solute carrier family 23 protein [Bacillota bacterium]